MPKAPDYYGPRNTYSPTYRCWSAMLQRCKNPKNKAFSYYGGRGIRVDARWETFENFYDDMGPVPGPRYEIDRIDTNGPYALWNCRWATRKMQTRNSRRNHTITYHGKERCLAEWEEFTGIPQRTIQKRLSDGWTVERTLETPVRGFMRLTYNGLTLSPLEWSERIGVERGVIYKRLKEGYSLHEVLGPRMREDHRREAPLRRGRIGPVPRILTYRGESLSVTEWATRVGLPRHIIFQRLTAGWPIDDVLTIPKESRNPKDSCSSAQGLSLRQCPRSQ
jgi:hypothetical protein